MPLRWMSVPSAAMAFVLVAGPVRARPIPEVAVPSGAFRDNLNDQLQTAGGALFGLMDAGLSARLAKPTIYLSGIQASDRTVCVSIRQVTGGYSADFTMRNPGLGGLVAFRLPKQKVDVRGRPAAELAILARASTGAACSRKDPVLVASWTTAPGRSLMALVNNHQADRARTVRPQIQADCLPLDRVIPGRALTRYQVACAVQLPVTGCAAAPLAIQLDNAGQRTYLRETLRGGCP